MQKKTLVFSSLSDDGATLRVDLPTSWGGLDDGALRYVLRLLAAGIPAERLLVYAFVRLAGLRVVQRLRGDVLLVRCGSALLALTADDLLGAALRLDFLIDAPDAPARLGRWHGVPAADASLHGVPFGVYLQVENYYQRFLQAPKEHALLFEAARLLYPGFDGRCAEAERGLFSLNLLVWIAGLKRQFAAAFPALFRRTAAEDEAPDLRALMLAEIRALTAGDVTKESDVLNVDTWTALAELNEKVREARELEKLYKK